MGIVIIEKLFLDFRVLVHILSTQDAFFVSCVLLVSDAHNDVDCILHYIIRIENSNKLCNKCNHLFSELANVRNVDTLASRWLQRSQ